jgi:hypothetical protein
LSQSDPLIGEPPFVSVQIGTLGILTCGLLAALSVAVAVYAQSAVLGIFAVVCTAAAVLVATLTISVDSSGVKWFFTGRLFSRRLSFEQIESCVPQRILPLRLGYSSAFGKRSWIVSGRSAVELRSGGMTYIISSSEPDRVCAEIARRSSKV